MNHLSRGRSHSGGRRRAGERADLTPADVLTAARHVADESGVDSLSMRRMGSELGVAANAIYTYFPSKLALLDALLDDLLGEVPLPDAAGASWQEGILTVMRGSREMLLRHPRLIEQFFVRPGGPNAWNLGERTLELLARGGIDGAMGGVALRALLAYTLGSAAASAPRPTTGRAEGPTGHAVDRIRALPEDRFPRVRAAEQTLAEPPGEEEFRRGLCWLLTGIGAHRSNDD